MRKKIFAVAALLLLLSACRNDEVIIDGSEQPSTPETAPLTIVAGIGNRTRIAYGDKDDNGVTKVLWNQGEEQFSLVYNDAAAETSYLFTKEAGESAVASAPFTCEAAPTDVEEETTLYTIYPGSEAIAANSTTVALDLSRQTGTADALNRNHLMVATTTAPANLGDLELQFQHKVAVLKLTLQHDDFKNKSVSGVSIKATGLKNQGTYTLAEGTWNSAIDAGNEIKLYGSATADNAGNATFYITLMPGTLTDVAVEAFCDMKQYTVSLGTATVEAGKIYEVTKSGMTESTLAVMKFTIRTTEDYQEFAFPFAEEVSGYALTADWGYKGEETTITSGSSLRCLYATPGTYTITLKSSRITDAAAVQMPAWNFFNKETASAALLVSIDTPMLRVSSFSHCFFGCTGLTAIPAGLFDNHTAVTNFSHCFFDCTGLTAIPAGLFDKHTAVTDFSYCFYGCTGLTEIPAGLFDNHTEVESFRDCFSYCTGLTAIPARLFANNTKVTSFNSCFYSCTGLTAIPAGLFANNTKVTSFNSCFYRCTGLTAIPSGLFDNHTEVTNFGSCFSGCTGLTAIPSGLFDNHTEVTSFRSCFDGCTGLTAIPEGLFDSNTGATNFSYCFYGCTKLTLNPYIFWTSDNAAWNDRFLDKAMDFTQCFYNCGSDLTGEGGIAPELWLCNKGTGTWITTGCFSKAKVTNTDIPSGW